MMLRAWSPAYGSIGILCERGEKIMWILSSETPQEEVTSLGCTLRGDVGP